MGRVWSHPARRGHFGNDELLRKTVSQWKSLLEMVRFLSMTHFLASTSPPRLSFSANANPTTNTLRSRLLSSGDSSDDDEELDLQHVEATVPSLLRAQRRLQKKRRQYFEPLDIDVETATEGDSEVPSIEVTGSGAAVPTTESSARSRRLSQV